MTEGRPRESGEEGSCGGPVPAAVRESLLFATAGPRTAAAPAAAARAVEASLLKTITNLFDDEADADTDEDSVAGLPKLPPMKGRSVLRVRRSIDECLDDAASHLSEATAVTPSCALSAAFSQDLSIHTPRRGSCDTSAATALPPLPCTPGAPGGAAALRACKKLRPSLDFGSRSVARTAPDWGAPPPFPSGPAAAAPAAPTAPAAGAPPPVPRSLPSVSLAGLLPDQVEHAIGAAKRAAPGGRGPLGLRLDTAALVRELNAARGAAAGRRFSACF